MAKQSSKNINLIVPGITNYEKLRNINTGSAKIHRFNPFVSQLYSEKVKKQHEAESLDARYLDEDVYNEMLMMNTNSHRNSKKTSYYGLSAKNKRAQLIRLSIHDVVDEVLTKLTDEIVVNAQGKPPVQLKLDETKLDKSSLTKAFQKQLTEYAKNELDRIIKMYGFNESSAATSIWNKVYLLLVEGSQAYEYVWDNLDNPKKIIGIHEIDPLELQPFFYEGRKYWKHHKQLARKEDYIILYDTQVGVIDWSEASPNNRTSYLEHLFKSFNDLRIIDEATLNWTITNAMFRLVIKVPTKGKSRIAAAQSLATEKHRYNDDIQYNSETGELNINGMANQMMMKTYWMAEGDSGSPSIEPVGGDGPELNDTNRNEYFSRKFYRAARMPYSRFDANASESWNIDTRSQLREEISFGRLVTRIQDIVKMLYLKPLYLSLVAKFPELQNDNELLDAISVRFNSYSIFEELMLLDVLQEKIDAIEKLVDSFKIDTPDGESMKYWSVEFLIREFLPEFTKDKLDENAKMVAQEQENAFKYQIKMYQLRAKYDPDRNINMETGELKPELLEEIEKELTIEVDSDNEIDDKKSIKSEVDNEKDDDSDDNILDADSKVDSKDKTEENKKD